MNYKLTTLLNNGLLVLFVAASLSACADLDSEVKREFRTKARDVISRHTAKLSSAYEVTSQMRGFGSNGIRWNAPYGGVIMQSDPNMDIETCMRLVQEIPRMREYYKMAIATTARCVTRSMSRRNPFFTQGAQQLPWGTQDMWAYDMNGNQFNTYTPTSNFVYAGMFSPYLNNGMIQSDLRIPMGR